MSPLGDASLKCPDFYDIITFKGASETGYWLELLHRTNYIDEQLYKSLSAMCTSLRVMLIASCRTAKENAK